MLSRYTVTMHAHASHAPFAHPGKNIESFHIEPNSVVADFGAGSGAYTFEIAKRLHGEGTVYAIDVQQDLLRRIKNEAHAKGLSTIQTIWGDIARENGTRLAPSSVDTVLMSNVLFQLEQPKHAFDEARRILKLGGCLIVIDWSDSFKNMGPTKQHVFDREQALESASISGFTKTEQFATGAHHYGLVFQKSTR